MIRVLLFALLVCLPTTGCDLQLIERSEELRVRVDVIPDTLDGYPPQSVDAVRLSSSGYQDDINIRIQDGFTVNGSAQIRWPPEDGPDSFGDDDPTQGLPAVVLARQVSGIGSGSVEIPAGDGLEPNAGNFRLTLPPGFYDVEIIPTVHTDLITRQIFEDRLASAFGDTFSFLLERGFPVHGRVVWTDTLHGYGVRGLIVEAWRQENGESRPAGPRVLTDENGAFSLALPSGMYELRLRPNSDQDEVPLLPELRLGLQVPEDLNDELEVAVSYFEPAIISGRVIDDEGLALAGVAVRVDGTELGDDPISGVYQGAFQSSVTTGSDGSFSLRVPQGNSYRLRLIPPPLADVGARVLNKNLNVAPSTNSVPLGDLVLGPKPLLLGQVTDPDGRPVVGATVVAVNFEVSGHSSSMITDAAGQYEMRLDAGGVQLEVYAPHGEGLVDAAPRSIDLAETGTVADLRLERGRVISGLLLDPRNVPIAAARIDFVHPDTAVRQGSTVSDADGRYQITIPREGLPLDTAP